MRRARSIRRGTEGASTRARRADVAWPDVAWDGSKGMLWHRKWRELVISITLKFHILTRHTIEQVRQFGGIADLEEDFIEKSHQLGNKLDHYVATMSNKGYEQQELAKVRRQWLPNDPRKDPV